jgi:hypothetical protein
MKKESSTSQSRVAATEGSPARKDGDQRWNAKRTALPQAEFRVIQTTHARFIRVGLRFAFAFTFASFVPFVVKAFDLQPETRNQRVSALFLRLCP